MCIIGVFETRRISKHFKDHLTTLCRNLFIIMLVDNSIKIIIIVHIFLMLYWNNKIKYEVSREVCVQWNVIAKYLYYQKSCNVLEIILYANIKYFFVL